MSNPSTLESIFFAALAKESPAERRAFLDEACATDAELRRGVERLLAAQAEVGSFLESPVSPPRYSGQGRSDSPPHFGEGLGEGTFDYAPISEHPGTVIGPYKLLQQIGEGGMGVVFMAEQTEPIQRTVALKIIKPGMDTRQVIARFEAERQALALMDHPNIARVLDAGTTGDEGVGFQVSGVSEEQPALALTPDTRHLTPSPGRPYFVMDLVKGVPITDYCNQQHLSVRQRLELMTHVCHAVQHAHQKGIIHRDLKPSNVLVAEYDGKPVPKVIDFGVAKATAQRLTERTMFTQYGQIVGTFEYMSPEQARFNQLDVDTRSDIYSLGVLLYELLAGSTPLEKERLRTAAFDEILRIISEEDPPRPSTRLSSLSLRERAGVRANDSLPSAGRAGEGANNSLSLAERAGERGSSLATIAANRKSDPAKLSKELRGELDWIVMKCLEKDRNRRYETANNFAADIERYLNDEPVQACPPSAVYRFGKFARRNKKTLATVMFGSIALLLVVGSLGWTMRDRAVRRFLLEQQVTQALVETQDWYQRDRMPDALATLQRAEDLLGSGSEGNEELRRRVRQWRTDLEMVTRLEEIRLEHSAVGKNEAFDGAGADSAYREAFRKYGVDFIVRDADGAAEAIKNSAIKHHLVAALDDWLGAVGTEVPNWNRLLTVARRADGDPWRGRFREALEEGIQRGDVTSVVTLARDKEVLSQPPATVLLLGQALGDNGQASLAVEVLRHSQQRHPDDFWLNHALAQTLQKVTPPPTDEVVGYFRAAVALHPESPGALLNLGHALEQHGKIDEAIAAYRRTIELKPDYATPHHNLGRILKDQGKLDEAEAMHRKAIALGHPDRAEGHLALGRVFLKQGKLDESIAECRTAIELKPDFAEAYNSLGVALKDQGKLDEALAAYHKAIELKPDYSDTYNNLGIALKIQGKLDEAIAMLRKAIELKPDVDVYTNLGATLHAQGTWDEAVNAYQQAIELNPEYANAYYGLGGTLKEQGKLDEAVAAYRKAIELKPDFADAYGNLGNVFHDQRKLDAAVVAHRKAIELKPDNAGAYNNLGNVFSNQRKLDEAVAAHRKATELQPDQPLFFLNLASDLKTQGKWDEWSAAVREADNLLPAVVTHHEKVANALSGNVWSLLFHADPKFRDSDRALELATKAAELGPQEAMSWQVLGWAHYRKGDWQASVAALEKSCKLQDNGVGDAFQWLFLAMANWQLGHQDQARMWFDKAIQNEKVWPDDLRRFRTEAEELLGVNEENKSSIAQ